MGVPYAQQLADKQAYVQGLLPAVPQWLPPASGSESGFRTRAKLAVGGTVQQPTLGILDGDGTGVDLTGCGLYPPAMPAAFGPLARFVTRAGLVPYDVPGRRGELKYVHVTLAPDEALMVRFVLRSTEALPRVRKHLPWLREQLPNLLVTSVNLHPAHAALLEGQEEVPLTAEQMLPLDLGPVRLLARPQGFLQTNTAVATQLYRQAAAWVDEIAPARVWDLYCGTGGFALHFAAPGREVVGVETSVQAVEAARAAATGLPSVRFVAADAGQWARSTNETADLVVVNPPRRGLGEGFARWLDGSAARHLVYSSCDAASLARDLAAMPGWRPVRARLFDMFPQTQHHEMLVQLGRK